MGDIIRREHPLDCFSELSGVTPEGATFGTPLGASFTLSRQELEIRSRELSELFFRLATAPWELNLSPRMERALRVEAFVVELAQKEIARPREVVQHRSVCREIHGVNPGVNHKPALTPRLPSC